MTNAAHPSQRAKRVRNALLASVFTLGIVGAAGTGVLVSNSHMAFAEPVRVEATAPADFSAIVEQVTPAVVSVQVKTEVAAVANREDMPEGFDDLPPGLQDFFRRFDMPRGFGDDNDNSGREPFHPRRGVSQGSGFFISEDGYVVTNAHVVADATAYTVTTSDGRELDAKLIGKDERTDLALLKVDGDDFKYVTFTHDQPKVGQWVLAVGNPFGLGGSVTAGIISANGRDIGSGPYDDYLQIDAPVNRGNSGGPTFNMHGEVVGVNTAIFSPSGGNVGIAFAIPASIVSDVIGDLRDDGAVTRGWLGVQIQPVTEDIAGSLGIESTKGAIVADATADGPAASAGIKAGDIITSVNGKAVDSPKALSETIAAIDPGEKITVTVMRDGQSQELSVTLGNLNDFDEQQQASADQPQPDSTTAPTSLETLGLTLEKNPDGEGVRVAKVTEDSPAADRGLQEGDVIVAVGSRTVNSVSDVEEGITAAQDRGRDAVLFRVQREDGTRFVGVPFDRG
jgi:serine protease Do